MIVDHIMMYDINKIHFQPKLKFFQIFYENHAMIPSEKRAFQKDTFLKKSDFLNEKTFEKISKAVFSNVFWHHQFSPASIFEKFMKFNKTTFSRNFT